MPFNANTCTPELVETMSTRRFRWLQSTYLACIGYGVVVTLACMCASLIFQNIYTHLQRIAASDTHRKSPPIDLRLFRVPRLRVGMWMQAFSPRMVALLVYVSVMTTLSSMTIASTMKTTTKALVWTGCWDGVTTDKTPIALDAMGNLAYVLANWGADGILVWRCWVLYKGSSRLLVWASLAIPVCLYMAVIGMGLAFMVPGRPAAATRVYELIYSCLTLALNVVVTCMISLRLLFCRYKVKTALGRTQSVQYNSIIAMLIESAALVVIFNSFFVATIRTQSLFHYIAFAGNVQAQVIAPLLIIFRVLQGKAWTSDQTNQGTVDQWKFASYAGSSAFDRTATLAAGEEGQARTSMGRVHSRDDILDTKHEHLHDGWQRELV